jgi:hypothetical protein
MLDSVPHATSKTVDQTTAQSEVLVNAAWSALGAGLVNQNQVFNGEYCFQVSTLFHQYCFQILFHQVFNKNIVFKFAMYSRCQMLQAFKYFLVDHLLIVCTGVLQLISSDLHNTNLDDMC